MDKNKKRTHSWLNLNRLQLPLANANYGSFNTIISQKSDGFNTSKSKNNKSDT